MQRVEIDWSDLSHAFESGSAEVRFYFDRQTGEVIPLTDEVLQYMESAPGGAAILGEPPDWMRESVEEAARILGDGEGRFLLVPPADTAEEYRDMEEFIATVGDPRLQGELWRAIRGSGAFRRFKDTLRDFTSERERWFAYHDGRTLERMNRWLAAQKIEPSNPMQPPTVPPSDGKEPADATAERQELIEELTLLLIYLSSWDEQVAPGLAIRKAWKGYTFDTLNALEDRGLIHQSREAKSVALTEEGIHLARELEMRFKP